MPARPTRIVWTPRGIALLDASTSASTVRRLENGQVTTLIQLADPAWDLDAEDGGSLLVAVPGAILRVRSQ